MTFHPLPSQALSVGGAGEGEGLSLSSLWRVLLRGTDKQEERCINVGNA